MYMSMYIYIYTYVYVYIYIHVYIYIYMCWMFFWATALGIYIIYTIYRSWFWIYHQKSDSVSKWGGNNQLVMVPAESPSRRWGTPVMSGLSTSLSTYNMYYHNVCICIYIYTTNPRIRLVIFANSAFTSSSAPQRSSAEGLRAWRVLVCISSAREWIGPAFKLGHGRKVGRKKCVGIQDFYDQQTLWV